MQRSQRAARPTHTPTHTEDRSSAFSKQMTSGLIAAKRVAAVFTNAACSASRPRPHHHLQRCARRRGVQSRAKAPNHNLQRRLGTESVGCMALCHCLSIKKRQSSNPNPWTESLESTFLGAAAPFARRERMLRRGCGRGMMPVSRSSREAPKDAARTCTLIHRALDSWDFLRKRTIACKL